MDAEKHAFLKLYLNIQTHPDNCNYSEIHDSYILSKDCEWRDDVRDYVYIGEYSFMNDNSSIEERIKLNKEQEETRISRRISSTSEVSDLMSELQRIGMDYFSLRRNIEVERENQIEESTDNQ